MFKISPAKENEFDLIWPIFRDIVKTGDTYVYDPKITKSGARIVWFDKKFYTFIARDKGKVVGGYVIRPNHRDLGDHIANAAYIVAREYQNKGYGRKMAKHSFVQARKAKYQGMQFNFVVSTNQRAVNLWKSLGFKIIGTVPKAFRHQQLKKLVSIYIMHKEL